MGDMNQCELQLLWDNNANVEKKSFEDIDLFRNLLCTLSLVQSVALSYVIY